jgi:hypothetical protein
VIARFEELMETVRVLAVPASDAWMAEVPAFGLNLWAIAAEREDAELALRQVVWRWLGGVNGAPVDPVRARRGFSALLAAIATGNVTA